MQVGSESKNKGHKQLLIGVGAIVAIVASVAWICWFEFGQSNQNTQLQRAVGEVMAEETSRIVGPSGRIVVVTVDNRAAPELKIQLDAFEKHLKSLGMLSIKDKLVLDPGDNPKFRPGAGLSAKRFLKIVRKNTDAAGIVSFVGAPQMTDEELAQMKTTPKLVAETHSPEKLVNLLQKKVLLSAIVPRYEFPAPGPRKPKTNRQWFDRYFQILSPETALVKGDDAP